MDNISYKIREMKKSEQHLLRDLLYEAIFQADEDNLLPKEVIEKPEIAVYINDFGKQDDYCLVAEHAGEIMGAVWVRILAGDIKGFGNLDDNTPEFSISVFKEYRKKGIGTALMKTMIDYLKIKGYEKGSLSVTKTNYAVELYKSFGFKIIEERNDDYLMVLELT